jgi:hypothetical protein
VSAHDQQHEEQLQAWITGDLAEDSALLRRLEECAVCSERAAQLREAKCHVDAAGREQRSVLAEARAMRGARGEQLVAQLVREGLHRRRRSVTLRRGWPWLAFAAAIVVGAVVWWVGSGTSGTSPLPPDRNLGQGSGYGPVGLVRDLVGGFQWPGELRNGEKFVLTVYDLSDPFSSLAEIPCATNHFLPDPDLVERMRGRDLSWVVARVGADGRELERSDQHDFSLSR